MSRRALWAWALYDLANTTFSLNVVSRYLPLLVVQDLGGRDLDVSLAYSGSMLLVALTAPVAGAMSDVAGGRLWFLAAATLLSVGATACMGWAARLVPLLLLFAAANFGYQIALVFYDALLADVSDEATRGRASGLGVGLGYVGSIVSLYSVAPIAERWGKTAAFPATALLFFIFALPCFLFVRERRTVAGGRSESVIATSVRRVRRTLGRLGELPALARFLVAHFLYTDAVNTVILFMAVYATVVAGFTSGEVTTLLALSTLFAIAGALGQGRLIDRVGARPALFAALWVWVVALILTVAATGKPTLWVVGPLVGIGLGSLWSADRVLMFRLSPPDELGEFYGVYGMVGRFSAITGPLIWGGIVWFLAGSGAFAYRVAVGSLLAMLVSGMVVLRGVSEEGATS